MHRTQAGNQQFADVLQKSVFHEGSVGEVHCCANPNREDLLTCLPNKSLGELVSKLAPDLLRLHEVAA